MDAETPLASVGQSPPRPDGAAKVAGTALYVDDIVLPDMLWGATVRSPHPCALIGGIDATAARADPGVTVFTAKDLPGPNVLRLIEDDWPVLAERSTDHVGEAVALVAAPTRQRALEAAARIKVAYEPTPAVLSLSEALEAEARGAGQAKILAAATIQHGDVTQGFAAARHILQGVFETGLQEHIYVETQGMLATPHADGSLELLGSLQCPYYVHKALSHLFQGACSGIRVRQAVTGGGFGGKEEYPNMIGAHAALLAWKSRRPVKMVYDRHEDIIATTKRHPAHVFHRTGFQSDGTLSAMEIEVILDGGAYVTLSPVVLSRAVLHAAGPYRCPHVTIRGRVLMTNMTPSGAFRGFGAPQTQFAMERQMDRIARKLKLDPFTIREKNAYRIGDRTPTGQVLDESTSAWDVLQEAQRRTDFKRRWQACEAARQKRQELDGEPARGLGLSFFWHGSGFTGNGEREMCCEAAVELRPQGRVRVLAASCDFGQGTRVVLAQMVADALGIPLKLVELGEPDTAVVPDSGPTVASRTVMVVGGVLCRAGRKLGERLCAYVAGKTPQAAAPVRLKGGRFLDARGQDLGFFGDQAQAFLDQMGPLRVQEHFQPSEEVGFDEERYQGNAYAAYGFGCDVVEVAVDPDTLQVQAEKATLVCDVGRAVHPVLCTGQIEGGTLQALGWGSLEDMKVAGGHLQNDRLSTYIIPTICDTPAMETVLIEKPTRANPVGAKGVGELPMDGGAPALLSAIENATGIVCKSLPATPESLLEHLLSGETVEGSRKNPPGEGP